jgi:hypothetical protein
MTRSLGVILAAILLSQPRMSPETARGYATEVRSVARDRHVDPLTIVAMVHYESMWIASVGSNACVGLGGICLASFRACQLDLDDPGCRAKRLELLDGRANLRAMGSFIQSNRDFCRKKTGRAELRHWLASYQGLNRPGAGVWCGQRRVRGKWTDVPTHWITRRVLDRRRMLIRRLAEPRASRQ